MPTLTELKSAIDRLLSLAASQQLLTLNSDTAERAFEAYTLSLCTQAVRNAGGSAILTGRKSGPNPSPVIFRGAPGSMGSAVQDFCYVDCRLQNKTFEIHLDVIYEGQSGASHEIDVSLCSKVHADAVRSTRREPRTNKHLIAAMECKFYQSTPGVVLARTFVGLLKDCSPNRFNAFVSNQSSLPLSQFLGASWAPQPFTDLSPLVPASEQRFVASLEQALRKWADSR